MNQDLNSNQNNNSQTPVTASDTPSDNQSKAVDQTLKDQPQSPAPPPPPSPPPPSSQSTTPQTPIPSKTPPESQDIGVGKPNIGVEIDEKSPSSRPKSDKTPTAPQPGPVSPGPSLPPETTPSAQTSPATEEKTFPPPLSGQQPPDQEDKIDVQSMDVPIKSYAPEKTTDQPQTTQTPPPQITIQPPIKAGSSPSAKLTLLAILALILGTAGGFWGFKYYDRLQTSASVEASPTPTIGESPTSTTNQGKSFSSTLYKFSLQYPDGWFALTTDPTAEKLVFASNQESLEGTTTGYRVEIVFQDSNGKTLKNWVETNAVTTNETSPIKEITIDQQTAFQQELTNNTHAVATYIERSDKIMIVTYTAPGDIFGQGGDWYNNLINSIKLT